MSTFTKLPLSASVSGKNVLLTTTASSVAIPIHTAPVGSLSLDEVWIYAYNEASASVVTSILWGGTSEPTDVTRHNVSSRVGRTLLIDGKVIQGGLTVSAYASTASVIVFDGYINRMTY